ncbi:hypothetical protein HO173_003207 [Letharia columbiana]|uniref:Uncharacterized protein n=1 Tax=Letharia columbiana TaxID=112416 RepID=A0A8H6G1D5_9LECA|nr:uncharacterized protein HO173_003207 [Letharia columbiana]KAF6238701.1 hypothetical protein HO173_003207 [Letharia columbiana]
MKGQATPIDNPEALLNGYHLTSQTFRTTQTLTAHTCTSGKIESTSIGTINLFDQKRPLQHPSLITNKRTAMSSSTRPEDSVIDSHSASLEKEHKARVSKLAKRKRNVEDTEGGGAHEAGLLGAKRHCAEIYKMNRSAQSDQQGASNQQMSDTKGQGIDEMNIDSNNKEASWIPSSTKKMGIKPGNEVKNDMDWAE